MKVKWIKPPSGKVNTGQLQIIAESDTERVILSEFIRIEQESKHKFRINGFSKNSLSIGFDWK